MYIRKIDIVFDQCGVKKKYVIKMDIYKRKYRNIEKLPTGVGNIIIACFSKM